MTITPTRDWQLEMSEPYQKHIWHIKEKETIMTSRNTGKIFTNQKFSIILDTDKFQMLVLQ